MAAVLSQPAAAPVVGLPRALLYHKYAPLWKTFFESLGCKVLVSPATNRAILTQGLQLAIDETCLPVKVFLGHVHSLIEKADYIFIPHILTLHASERMCVKLFALGDLVRNVFRGVRLLEYDVDNEKRRTEFWGMVRIGLRLNPNIIAVLRAVFAARAALAKHNQAELLKQQKQVEVEHDCRVLVVAHKYVTHDALMGQPISAILRNLGVGVVYADIADSDAARTRSREISADCYWTYSKELLGGLAIYKDSVDGIIFLTTFPCGPDSLIFTLCQYVLKDKPSCVLTLDELQGDAGLKTRLESFVDILRIKQEASR